MYVMKLKFQYYIPLQSSKTSGMLFYRTEIILKSVMEMEERMEAEFAKLSRKLYKPQTK